MSIEKDIREIRNQLEEIKNIISRNMGEQINSYNEEEEIDPLLGSAVEFVIKNEMASTSIIQRKFNLGYARAGRILDKMEDLGIVSGYRGYKPRDILMTMDQWEIVKKKNNIK